MQEVSSILENFIPISLNQMNAVNLLNRYDSKYQLPVSQLCHVLNAIKDDYYVLMINDCAYQSYQTNYYDTGNDSFYLNHHNGKLNRLKIRKREYVNSGSVFLEIKQKNNKGKTNKTRIQVKNRSTKLSIEELDFLEQHNCLNSNLSTINLMVTNSNSFKRITLVNKDFKERCTIDLKLTFSNKNKQINISDIAIIELKQGHLNMKTPLFNALKERRIKQDGFSKYCVGRAFLEPKLKQNRFKPKLLQLKKHFNAYHMNVDQTCHSYAI